MVKILGILGKHSFLNTKLLFYIASLKGYLLLTVRTQTLVLLSTFKTYLEMDINSVTKIII